MLLTNIKNLFSYKNQYIQNKIVQLKQHIKYNKYYIEKIIYFIKIKIIQLINQYNNNNKNINFFKNIACFIILILCILILWISSGFYIIKEAERGVILRFGKFNHIVYPGLNWKPTFIDTVKTVNVETIRELVSSGIMLTADENVIHVEMNIQYRVTSPTEYLFNVIHADDSLRQATDSALRGVIGKYNMDTILTEGRTIIRNDTQNILENTILPYNMGITLLDVNFQTARPPEEVKAAFDDAIAARENEQQYIREAEAYSNEVEPKAYGKAQRIIEEGRAYKAKTILEAQGEIKKFIKILPEYKKHPLITQERLYIDAMEYILHNTNKIINEKENNNIYILNLQQSKNFSSDNLTNNKNKKISDTPKIKNLKSIHNISNITTKPIKTTDNISSSIYQKNFNTEHTNNILRIQRK